MRLSCDFLGLAEIGGIGEYDRRLEESGGVIVKLDYWPVSELTMDLDSRSVTAVFYAAIATPAT